MSSMQNLLLAALLALPPFAAKSDPVSPVAPASLPPAAAKIDAEALPAYRKEFERICPGLGIALEVKLDGFLADPPALTAFTASAVSDPWNRAVGPLMTVLRDRCSVAAQRQRVGERLRTVAVAHSKGLPTAQLTFVDGVYTITVDANRLAPPVFAEVAALFDQGLQ